MHGKQCWALRGCVTPELLPGCADVSSIEPLWCEARAQIFFEGGLEIIANPTWYMPTQFLWCWPASLCRGTHQGIP